MLAIEHLQVGFPLAARFGLAGRQLTHRMRSRRKLLRIVATFGFISDRDLLSVLHASRRTSPRNVAVRPSSCLVAVGSGGPISTLALFDAMYMYKL